MPYRFHTPSEKKLALIETGCGHFMYNPLLIGHLMADTSICTLELRR